MSDDTRYRAVFNYASVGIAICDFNRRFVEVNPAYCAMTGYRAEELVGVDFQAITHPDDLESNTESFQRMAAGEIAKVEIEKRIIKKNGEILWVHISVSFLRDEQGKPTNILAVSHDITERKTNI